MLLRKWSQCTAFIRAMGRVPCSAVRKGQPEMFCGNENEWTGIEGGLCATQISKPELFIDLFMIIIHYPPSSKIPWCIATAAHDTFGYISHNFRAKGTLSYQQRWSVHWSWISRWRVLVSIFRLSTHIFLPRYQLVLLRSRIPSSKSVNSSSYPHNATAVLSCSCFHRHAVRSMSMATRTMTLCQRIRIKAGHCEHCCSGIKHIVGFFLHASQPLVSIIWTFQLLGASQHMVHKLSNVIYGWLHKLSNVIYGWHLPFYFLS